MTDRENTPRTLTREEKEERARLGIWKNYMLHHRDAVSRSQQALRSYGEVKMPKLSFLKDDEE